MYLTYAEYQAYGGTLAEADFNLAEFRARKRIDYLTDGRVEAMANSPRPSGTPRNSISQPLAGSSLREGAETGGIPEAVKLAVMSIIKADGAVGVDAQAGAPLVASFSTDGYSENYGSAAEQTASVEKRLNAELRRLLAGEKDDEGVPLLYRGTVIN